MFCSFRPTRKSSRDSFHDGGERIPRAPQRKRGLKRPWSTWEQLSRRIEDDEVRQPTGGRSMAGDVGVAVRRGLLLGDRG